jgi:hypothetical protein
MLIDGQETGECLLDRASGLVSNYFGVSGMEDDDGVGDFRMMMLMMKQLLFLVDVRLFGEIGYIFLMDTGECWLIRVDGGWAGLTRYIVGPWNGLHDASDLVPAASQEDPKSQNKRGELVVCWAGVFV